MEEIHPIMIGLIIMTGVIFGYAILSLLRMRSEDRHYIRTKYPRDIQEFM